MCPFLTAQSLDGEVFLLLGHLSNCKLMVLRRWRISTTHSYTLTHRLTPVVGYLHVRSKPLPFVWHHLFWVMWPCFISTVGTLVLNRISSVRLCTLQMLHVKATRRQAEMNSLFGVTIFKPFLTWRKNNTGLHTVVVFVLILPPAHPPEQMLLPQASHDLKLISPLLMNAKITLHVTWRRESCIALSINFSQSRSLYASTATWRNAMYVFWLSDKPNDRVNLSVWRTIKVFLDGNELTQSCSLVCVFIFPVANVLGSLYRIWLKEKKQTTFLISMYVVVHDRSALSSDPATWLNYGRCVE